ncbi:IclR family transcriptional regulator [Pannonibacter phragmitetus]|uniref:IclR family transcriptional regulator n=1 Tax=Pannonibacter phragmitetus TaxID=121719 RepID=UPI003D2EEB85
MKDENDPRFATTLARGLSVLRAFRMGEDGLSNAEIAQRTGLPKSTVSRLTWTLVRLGYLVQSSNDDRFRPGPTLIAVGQVAGSSLSFLVPAHELMSELADATGTLVVLSVRDGDKLVLIRTWRPRGVSSIWLEVGQRIPMRRTASARAYSAALTSAEFEQLLNARDFLKLRSCTAGRRSAIRPFPSWQPRASCARRAAPRAGLPITPCRFPSAPASLPNP